MRNVCTPCIPTCREEYGAFQRLHAMFFPRKEGRRPFPVCQEKEPAAQHRPVTASFQEDSEARENQGQVPLQRKQAERQEQSRCFHGRFLRILRKNGCEDRQATDLRHVAHHESLFLRLRGTPDANDTFFRFSMAKDDARAKNSTPQERKANALKTSARLRKRPADARKNARHEGI